jgi:hypothetical protein
VDYCSQKEECCAEKNARDEEAKADASNYLRGKAQVQELSSSKTVVGIQTSQKRARPADIRNY